MCVCMKQLVARAEAEPATRAVVGLVIGAVAGVQEQLHSTTSRSTSSILDRLCGELNGVNLLPDDGMKTP